MPVYKCRVCGTLTNGRIAHQIQSYRAEYAAQEADAMLAGILGGLKYPVYEMPSKVKRHLCSILAPNRPPSIKGGYAICDIVGVQVGGLIEKTNPVVNQADSQLLKNLRDHVLPKLRTAVKNLEEKHPLLAQDGLGDCIEIVKTLCDGKGLYVE